MGRNFDDYPGFQPFRSWANTYAQDCTFYLVSFFGKGIAVIVKVCSVQNWFLNQVVISSKVLQFVVPLVSWGTFVARQANS